jgi:hypothetical protein
VDLRQNELLPDGPSTLLRELVVVLEGALFRGVAFDDDVANPVVAVEQARDESQRWDTL